MGERGRREMTRERKKICLNLFNPVEKKKRKERGKN